LDDVRAGDDRVDVENGVKDDASAVDPVVGSPCCDCDEAAEDTPESAEPPAVIS
jgi:hypothetical protein